RPLDSPLPWDHLHCGVSRRFLDIERQRALQGATTLDCRYNSCRQCGACPSETAKIPRDQAPSGIVMPRVNRTSFRRDAPMTHSNTTRRDLSAKACHHRIWHRKTGLCSYLSQLELQRVLERAMRRADLPLSFSQGYSPSPCMSFGWALPVGVESREEWFNAFFREEVEPGRVAESLRGQMPEGLEVTRIERLGPGKRQSRTLAEDFSLTVHAGSLRGKPLTRIWDEFLHASSWVVEVTGKKGKIREADMKPFVLEVLYFEPSSVSLLLDWREGYVNPLRLVSAVCPDLEPQDFVLVKERQWMDENLKWRLESMGGRSGTVSSGALKNFMEEKG
ncbi:MAG: DUF2344 domain-containing protein, partial [Deltaproteobacteria bacterium]|nr:DUF2344 domain-containing protein [Deltaproteobacteria bacterium]